MSKVEGCLAARRRSKLAADLRGIPWEAAAKVGVALAKVELPDAAVNAPTSTRR